MSTEHQVDWRAAVRRERRRDAVQVLPSVGWATGLILLNRDLVSAHRAPWVAAALGLVVLGITVGVRWLRTDCYRMRYAIREHVDPGPALRARTDRLAEKQSWLWYRWGIPFSVPYACARGRWDLPALALPGAALVLASAAAAVLCARPVADAAARWLRDPPGPPREPDPGSQRPAQRELTIFFVGAGVLLVVLFVIALVTG